MPPCAPPLNAPLIYTCRPNIYILAYIHTYIWRRITVVVSDVWLESQEKIAVCMFISVHDTVCCVLPLGIGPKRAVNLIQKYKSIEEIMKHKSTLPGVSGAYVHAYVLSIFKVLYKCVHAVHSIFKLLHSYVRYGSKKTKHYRIKVNC